MKKLAILFVAVVALAVAAPAMAANSVTVTGQAALEGNYGLQVNLDGANNTGDAYVVTNHPTTEGTFRFSFRIHPGTLNMNASSGFRYFIIGDIRKSTPDRNFFFIYLMKQVNGWWGVQANARQDNGAFPAWQTPVNLCQATGATLPCSVYDGVGVELTYEWQKASAPGANDGFLKVYRDGNLARTFSNLDNDTQDVDSAWFGAIFMTGGGQNGDGTQASGAYYFDDFASYRTLATP
jgi:hypothetical protein